MDRGPFDIDKWRLRPEHIAARDEARRKSQAERRLAAKPGVFVMLPYELMLEVSGWRDASAAVLVELAYQAFRTHKSEIALPNTALKKVGGRPDAKVRALRRLEAAGVVKSIGAAEAKRRVSPG